VTAGWIVRLNQRKRLSIYIRSVPNRDPFESLEQDMPSRAYRIGQAGCGAPDLTARIQIRGFAARFAPGLEGEQTIGGSFASLLIVCLSLRRRSGSELESQSG
jgi:hypothetical protein